jgi:hypothetical protein
MPVMVLERAIEQGDAMDEPTHPPVIQEWSTPDGEHISGRVFSHGRYPDGTALVTSPIVALRLVGEHGRPLVTTRSDSVYWLGDPSGAFGREQAQAFVLRKLRDARPAPGANDHSTVSFAAPGAATRG